MRGGKALYVRGKSLRKMKKKGIEKEPYMDTAKFSKIIVYLLISTTLENMQITS